MSSLIYPVSRYLKLLSSFLDTLKLCRYHHKLISYPQLSFRCVCVCVRHICTYTDSSPQSTQMTSSLTAYAHTNYHSSSMYNPIIAKRIIVFHSNQLINANVVILNQLITSICVLPLLRPLLIVLRIFVF